MRAIVLITTQHFRAGYQIDVNYAGLQFSEHGCEDSGGWELIAIRRFGWVEIFRYRIEGRRVVLG